MGGRSGRGGGSSSDSPKEAGRMPDGRRIYEEEGKHYTRRKNSATDAESSVVVVDVEKLDKEWKKDDPDRYIPKGGNADSKGKRDGFREFQKSGGGKIDKPIEMPQVVVGPRGVSIEDGRHRTSVLRDQGVKKIPVLVDRSQVKEAKKRLQ